MSTNASSSHISSSSSSSSLEDELDLTSAILAQNKALLSAYTNNNLAMDYYMNTIVNQPKHKGSISGHRVIYRDRAAADQRLWDDYFAENPRYNAAMFRRRFRMSRNLFLRLVGAVEGHDVYFTQRRDGCGKLGLSSLQKVTAAFRMLAYGVSADSTDEYIKIGESTAIESTKRFCRAIVEVFGQIYLRAPNANDVARLLQINEKRGFPGMLGSLDCMHWTWQNCPTAWAGQYSGRRSNNDINVLEASHLFADLAKGIAPSAHYVIQGKVFDTGYYLADSIYPKWSTLVQTIHDPRGPKKKLFAKMQEACRKDVERAFGVLQLRFAIIKGPTRFWEKFVLHDLMSACIIMHNMIIEDERDTQVAIQDWSETPVSEININRDDTVVFQEFLARHRQIRDKEAHYELRNALIEHLWERYGNSND
ncbi:hypothetical protein K2173_027272 [Erythroxylum novogranatense]|uniref:Nuclease HARBI1 n=1 Tax=Erythroxylum novogranatense TaxID=1862640 RepID=A0AAV8U227_9ROSI|nr:hypothetical protein K2173_027272 [Erythroxylum novogranatense]